MYFYLAPSFLLGWALGRNDSANIFGPSAVNGLVSYKKAKVIAAIFVFTGAIVGGSAGLKTIGSLGSGGILGSSLALLSASISVIAMTQIGLPVSTSQAVVGGIVGIGIIHKSVNLSLLLKIVTCWVLTPLFAAFLGFVIYKALGFFLSRVKSIAVEDRLLIILAWLAGVYGTYSLGANNVANVTGAFVGNPLSVKSAAFIGGIAMAAGALSFSRKVMYTVGKKIVELDAFSSLVSLLSEALTVWIFSIIGVPVSTSQAVVGGVIGAGLARGTNLASKKILTRIFLGWIETPVISGAVAIILYKIFA